MFSRTLVLAQLYPQKTSDDERGRLRWWYRNEWAARLGKWIEVSMVMVLGFFVYSGLRGLYSPDADFDAFAVPRG